MTRQDATDAIWFVSQVGHHFGYLFDRYGFEVLHCEDATTDGRSLVVIESSDCRFRFLHNRGDVEISVGAHSAPISWQDTSESGIRQWYSIKLVLDFIMQRTVDLQEIRQQGREMFSMPTEELLSWWADKLERYCGHVVQLFQDDAFARTQMALQEYDHEQSKELRWQIDQEQRSISRTVEAQQTGTG